MSKDNKNAIYHETQCFVCKSGKRKEIEQFYLDGASITKTAHFFSYDYQVVHRHVMYFDLRSKRYENTLKSVQSVIEHCDDLKGINQLPATGQTIVSALRLEAELKCLLKPDQANIIVNVGRTEEISKTKDRNRLREIIGDNLHKLDLSNVSKSGQSDN